MRISDWSSDVCSSDLRVDFLRQRRSTTGGADRKQFRAKLYSQQFAAEIRHLFLCARISEAAARRNGEPAGGFGARAARLCAPTAHNCCEQLDRNLNRGERKSVEWGKREEERESLGGDR